MMFRNVKKSEFNFVIKDICREINEMKKQIQNMKKHCPNCEYLEQCQETTFQKSGE